MIIRKFRECDAIETLECHYSAVHTFGIKNYDQSVCDAWSSEIKEERISRFLETANNAIRFVAVIDNKIAGFAEYIPEKNMLGACYVHADFSGQGVATALLECLEDDARQSGICFLKMDSSVTALSFYQKMGYIYIAEGEHELNSGAKMKCIKMKKQL